jgi:predicted nucleotidyltransferase
MKLIEIFFGSRLKIRILRTMSLQKDWAFSISELSREIGSYKANVSKILNELEKENIVKSISKGRTKLYSLNTENLFVKKFIADYFKKEGEMPDTLGREILQVLKPQFIKEVVSVVLFGSVLTDKFTLNSDIDLLVLLKGKKCPESLENRIRRLSDYLESFDLHLFPMVLTLDEIRSMDAQGEPLIRTLKENNKSLYGKLIEVIL